MKIAAWPFRLLMRVDPHYHCEPMGRANSKLSPTQRYRKVSWYLGNLSQLSAYSLGKTGQKRRPETLFAAGENPENV